MLFSDPNYEKSFENVFEPIEKLQVPLYAAYDLIRTLQLINPSEYSRAFNRVCWQPRFHSIVIIDKVESIEFGIWRPQELFLPKVLPISLHISRIMKG